MPSTIGHAPDNVQSQKLYQLLQDTTNDIFHVHPKMNNDWKVPPILAELREPYPLHTNPIGKFPNGIPPDDPATEVPSQDLLAAGSQLDYHAWLFILDPGDYKLLASRPSFSSESDVPRRARLMYT